MLHSEELRCAQIHSTFAWLPKHGTKGLHNDRGLLFLLFLVPTPYEPGQEEAACHTGDHTHGKNAGGAACCCVAVAARVELVLGNIRRDTDG